MRYLNDKQIAKQMRTSDPNIMEWIVCLQKKTGRFQGTVIIPSIASFLLLACGPSIKATPIHQAARMGNLQQVNRLLDEDADLEAIDLGFDSYTILHSAVLGDNPEVVRRILNEGVNVDSRDINQNTPLHITAIGGGNPEIINLLIKYGADANARNTVGTSPLHFVAIYGATSSDAIESAQILLENGAEIKAKSDNGTTPLDLARTHSDSEEGEKLVELLSKYVSTN